MFLNSINKNSRLFKFKFKYREDDFVLGILPFILLFFLNKCNYYYTLPVIFFNTIYWYRKTLIPFIFDVLFAINFINITFQKCIEKKIYILPSIFLIIGTVFLYLSYKNRVSGKRQIYEHIIFRLTFFIIFLLSEI